MPVALLELAAGHRNVTLALAGAAAILAGLVLAVIAAGASYYGGWREQAASALVGRLALYGVAATLLLAAAVLEAALLTHDFTLVFVASHTDRATDPALLAASFYAGQEGSLLYWALVLSVLGSVSIAAARQGRVQAYASGVLASVLGFYLVVLALVASPFSVLAATPHDGIGLNPVLRDGGMLIHPPFLLAGFSSFAIPFSFAMAALMAGTPSATWIRHTRRVALLAWGLQSVGLVLGMWWAYHVLGWGGYWGWDPVENVALLPWLVSTAYIHSSQVQERSGQLKGWNYGLLIAAFLLSIFGTFIVRSGVVPSVHSFAVSPIGPWFFGFLCVAVVFSGTLLALRSDLLRSERGIPAVVSREGGFLLQNLVLVAIAVAVFWGTVLPLVSGLLTGREMVVGASFYDRVAGPLFLILLLLLAAGPLLPWSRAGRPWLRALRWPSGAATAGLIGLLLAGVRNPAALAAGGALAGAAAAAVTGLLRGRFDPRHRRRYGAYLAHLGIAIAAAGLTGSQLFQQQVQAVVHPGQTVRVGSYTLHYEGVQAEAGGDSIRQVATLRLGDETLQPYRVAYPSLGGQSLTRVAIRSTPIEDLYVVLAGTEPDGTAAFAVFVNPLVTWIWAGAALLILGVLIANFGPARIALPQPVPAPLREPARAGR
jgi:cytochrome c-type biogenesis protein CcmF